MEVSGELVGRRFAIEATEPLTLGVGEVTDGHVLRNSSFCEGGGRRKNKAISFAKAFREIKNFASVSHSREAAA